MGSHFFLIILIIRIAFCPLINASHTGSEDTEPAPNGPFGFTDRTKEDIDAFDAIIADYPFDFLEKMTENNKKNLVITLMTSPLTIDDIRARIHIIHDGYFFSIALSDEDRQKKMQTNFFKVAAYDHDRIELLEALLFLDVNKLHLLKDNLNLFYDGEFDVGFNLDLFQTIQTNPISWMRKKIQRYRTQTDQLSKENVPPPAKRHCGIYD